MADDSELLRAYSENRSEEAFAELVRRYLNLVYSAALRRVGGDTHLAEDISQKVFIALARQASGLVGRPTLTGWLYTTTRFASAEAVRTERRRRAREQETYIMRELSGNSAPDPDWEKLRPVLDEAMDQLNERDRDALLARFFEGRSLGEVGARLALSEDTARKCVDRSLERLRRLLVKRGISSTSAAIGVLLANQTVIAAPPSLAATTATSALAASGAAGPALTIFQIMSTSKTAVGVAVVFLGMSSFTALQSLWSRQEAESTLAAAVHQSAQTMTERLALETRLNATKSDAEQLKRRVDETQAAEKAEAARTTAGAAVANAAMVAAAPSPESLGTAFMSRHPEVKQALIEWFTASQNSDSALYRKLGLSPAQIAELQRLSSEHRGLAREVNGKITAFLLGNGMPADEVENRKRELLGAAGYEELVRYGSSTQARSMAAQVASELTFSDRPLSAEQYEQVVEILARGRIVTPSPEPRVFDWDRVLADGQAVLSQEQLAVLTRMQVQDEFQQAWSGVTAAKTTTTPSTSARPDTKR